MSWESLAEIITAYTDGTLSTTALQEKLRTLRPQVSKTPLSEGQRGLWMLHKLSPDMSAYNVPVCLRIGRQLDAEKLRAACAFLLEQFPILTSVSRRERRAVPGPRASSSPDSRRKHCRQRSLLPRSWTTCGNRERALCSWSKVPCCACICARHARSDGRAGGTVGPVHHAPHHL